MNRKILYTLLLLWITTGIQAQDFKLKGSVTDAQTGEKLMGMSIHLLKKDSTFVTGGVTDRQGAFDISVPQQGQYIVKISGIGYQSHVSHITAIPQRELPPLSIKLKADAVSLNGATITGQAIKVTLKNDTFVYNANALRTPAGSTIEELVKKIPGAEIDDNGKITVNGKEIKKILVNGKEFMMGDTQTALKNLPADIVDKIKTYERQSDTQRITGIDDGEEAPVLDFGLKRGMDKGLFSNANLGIGTRDRYAERLMAGYFNSGLRVMGFGNANNTNDNGFSNRTGRGMGKNGLNAKKLLGFNLNYEQQDKLDIDLSLRWHHNDNDINTRSTIENFVSKKAAFTHQARQKFGQSDSWNAYTHIEWQPDSKTNIILTANGSHNITDDLQYGTAASFDINPYEYTTDPLSQEGLLILKDRHSLVNTHTDRSVAASQNTDWNTSIQLNRRLGKKGRNINIMLQTGMTTQNTDNLMTNSVLLANIKDLHGNDSTYHTDRYNIMPTTNKSYGIQTSYTEPLWKSTYLQFRYLYTHKYNKGERNTYDFSHIDPSFSQGIPMHFDYRDTYLSHLPAPYTDFLDDKLSKYSEYKNQIHEMEISFKVTKRKYRLNIGLMAQPQKTNFIQQYLGRHTDTVRTVTNITPTMDFRYEFNEYTTLKAKYRGTTRQPSITQLIDIVDDSNPLNISMGNPGLKPSFTNRLNFVYNSYDPERQRAIMAFINYNSTNNDIVPKVTYDPQTGGRISRPENINGNWNASSAFMLNTPIDKAAKWNVSTFTRIGYNNYMGYLNLTRQEEAVKNSTTSTLLGQRLSLAYRSGWVDIEAHGSCDYLRSRNTLQKQSNRNTWDYSYGINLNVDCPWGTSFSSSLLEYSRRGYADRSFNTDKLIWNAQVSQSFLKDRALTLSLQLHDILHQQKSLTRNVSTMNVSENAYNSINSYAMLHAIYKFNAFGGMKGGHRRSGEKPYGRRNFQRYGWGHGRMF